MSFLGWELGINYGCCSNIKLLSDSVEGQGKVTSRFNARMGFTFKFSSKTKPLHEIAAIKRKKNAPRQSLSP